MQHLVVDPESITADPISIEGPAFHHLANVVRLRLGESIALLDGLGHAVQCTVNSVDRARIIVVRVGPHPLPPEPPIPIVVAQSIGKGDRFEQVLQHCTEAGASAFVPLITERTVSRPSESSAATKRDRWQAVVRGATEQSHRPSVPTVTAPRTVSDLIPPEPGLGVVLTQDASPLSGALAPWLAGALGRVPRPWLMLVVGPEGGFSSDELLALEHTGFLTGSLGPYVLRTETAAVVAVGAAMYHADQSLTAAEPM